MAKVRIEETGDRERDSSEFGFRVRVSDDVEGHEDLNYSNLAKHTEGGHYLLREHWNGSEDAFPRMIGIYFGKERADRMLYGRAKNAAKKALEELTPKLHDRTRYGKEKQ